MPPWLPRRLNRPPRGLNAPMAARPSRRRPKMAAAAEAAVRGRCAAALLKWRPLLRAPLGGVVLERPRLLACRPEES